MPLPFYKFRRLSREEYAEVELEIEFGRNRKMFETIPAPLFNMEVYRYICYNWTGKMMKKGWDISKLKVFIVKEPVLDDLRKRTTIIFIEDEKGYFDDFE